MLRQTYGRDKLLVEIGERTRYNLDDLRAMRDNEVINILQGKKVDLKNIRQRSRLTVSYYTPKSETFFYGRQAKIIYQIYINKIKSVNIKGIVASASVKKIKGEVCIIMDVNRDKFKPGAILVTSMTRPEFMPIMRKAKAVITDEGGVTCHAAIVSRELNIPCIIGTKNATKSLKNRDEIEMDLERGVIKI